MRGVLITGMSGAGKSTALDRWSRRGFRVIDTDEPGWTMWDEQDDGYVWREDRIAELLAVADAPTLFVSGTVWAAEQLPVVVVVGVAAAARARSAAAVTVPIERCSSSCGAWAWIRAVSSPNSSRCSFSIALVRRSCAFATRRRASIRSACVLRAGSC